MIRQVVLSEEEWEDLNSRAIDKNEYRYLKNCRNTLLAYFETEICPVCGSLMLKDHPCVGCGYNSETQKIDPEFIELDIDDL